MKKWLFVSLLLFANNCFAQNIRITRFEAANAYQDSDYFVDNQVVKLDFEKTHIIIHFKDFKDSLLAKYAFRLIGFEANWQKVESLTYANYINLLGGNYEFQVKNLRFPNKIATVKFHIEDAFWQKWWFIPATLGYLLFVAGIVFYFFQNYRFRQQMRMQQVRNDISADLHDDIGSTLSNISFLTEIAKSRISEKPHEVPMLLDKILEDSKEMIQTMRGMIWTINPTNDNANDFFLKIKNYVNEILNPHLINVIFDTQLPDNQKLMIEQQRNIFLVFKEATNNVMKYAHAKNVFITIRQEHEWLMLQLKDDGLGFDQNQESEGNGLRNMKNRIEHLGGRFEIKADEGVRLRIAIPLT